MVQLLAHLHHFPRRRRESDAARREGNRLAVGGCGLSGTDLIAVACERRRIELVHPAPAGGLTMQAAGYHSWNFQSWYFKGRAY